ncbi:MAG TPA: galactose oxidase-like domain-containing protein [Candidatus Angelobacter sp.]|jgi:hypothetical protein
MSIASSHVHRVVLLLSFIFIFAFQTSAFAQGQGADAQKPFIEPAEMHHERAAARAFIEATPQQNGRWDTLPWLMPINPVHVALMHNGKVLVIAGSGNDPDNKSLEAAVWQPGPDIVRSFKIDWDMFCNGMVVLPDGQPFVLGGTVKYDNFLGYRKTAMFNPATEKFTNGPDMSGGRWYPTGTVLSDGSVMVLSGLNDTSGSVNTTVQIFKAGAWSPAGTVFANPPLYPREHVLPNGKVFEDGANPNSQMFDPATKTWTAVATTKFGQSRDYGTSVLLPLLPANAYKPVAMIMGGGPNGTNTTATTELIDLSVPNPQWTMGPAMVKPRIQMNATLLPNGKVLVSGGSTVDEDTTTGVLDAQLYDPASNSFSSASTMAFARVYHSNTLLLPDATVAAVGGNPERKTYEPHVEIYSPPYLFKSDGTPAPRPVINQVSAASVGYGATFHVRSPQAANIKSVVLIRAGSVTHAFDMDQRLVGLTFSTQPGTLQVKSPPNGNLAPPGYYLLFILDDQGVPSVAQFLHLGTAASHQGGDGPGNGNHGGGKGPH